MTADSIYTIAGNGKAGSGGDGGPAAGAELDYPLGVAVDPAGDVAIADESGRRVRLLPAHSGGIFGMTVSGGDIYTIAGNGKEGFSGDGGPATAAQLGEPDAVAFDPAGNLLVSDGVNDRVRIVYGGPPPPPTVLAFPPRGSGSTPQKTPPRLGAVRQSHARWREGSRLARISGRTHRPPLGTTVSFALDQP